MDEVGGSALRLLHQLALSPSAAEAMCRAVPSASGPLMTALVKWGLAGSVLALETIKRALALGNPARDMLIAGLLSGGLLPLLLKKLDWQQGDKSDHDEEVGVSQIDWLLIFPTRLQGGTSDSMQFNNVQSKDKTSKLDCSIDLNQFVSHAYRIGMLCIEDHLGMLLLN